MANSEKQAREQRVQAMARRYAEFTSPPLNPQAYWSAKNYPTDPSEVDWRDPTRYFRTRLHVAAQRGDLSEVQRLIEVRGANPFVKDNSFCTPAAAAEDEGHFEVAEYLRERMQEAVQRWKQHEEDSGRQYRYRLG